MLSCPQHDSCKIVSFLLFCMLGCSEIVGKLKKFSCLISVACSEDITASVAEFHPWPFEVCFLALSCYWGFGFSFKFWIWKSLFYLCLLLMNRLFWGIFLPYWFLSAIHLDVVYMWFHGFSTTLSLSLSLTLSNNHVTFLTVFFFPFTFL